MDRFSLFISFILLFAADRAYPQQSAELGPEDEAVTIIYTSDLWTPYGDPDDHFDLLSLFSLKRVRIGAVVIDNTMRANELRTGVDKSPNVGAVLKANELSGHEGVPCVAGLKEPLLTADDDAHDRPVREQAAIQLILDELMRLPGRDAVIITTGSLRDVCAAYNRSPTLFHEKVRRMIISIGDSYGVAGLADTNTAKDTAAWNGIVTSGLPIDWMPTNPSKGRGGPSRYTSYWYFMQSELLTRCPEDVQQFFESEEIPVHDNRTRHMWSTPAFIESEGLKCYEVEGVLQWMLPEATASLPDAVERVPYEFIPVNFSLDERGVAVWEETAGETNVRILKIRDYYLYNKAMFRFSQQCYELR